MQHDGPLRREADFGYGGYRPANESAREPGIEQADALHVRTGEERSEGAET
jgi:hypothetical protein